MQAPPTTPPQRPKRSLMYPPLPTIPIQLLLRQERMYFRLIHSWHDFRRLQQQFKVHSREVSYADCTNFARRQERLHLSPGIPKIPTRKVLMSVFLAIGSAGGGIECDWPVHQVEVDVGELEVGE